MNIQDIRMDLERRKGQRKELQAAVKATRQVLAKADDEQADIQEAQALLQTVAQATQQELEYHISELVTLALAGVFANPYELCLDFELKRNRSEAFLTFRKRGREAKLDPMACTGGGAVDIAAMALRVSLWSLRRPRSRATIVMDEPFRFVSRDLQHKAAKMLKEISTRLGLQFIIITHERILIEYADRVFDVTQVEGVSQVAVL